MWQRWALTSLRSWFSLVETAHEAPLPIPPPGGDHSKRTFSLSEALVIFQCGCALCHFFHERYQRNFCVWAFPSNMNIQLAPTHGQPLQGPWSPCLLRGLSPGKGSLQRDYPRFFCSLWLCYLHFLRAKWCFFLCFFFHVLCMLRNGGFAFFNIIFKVWKHIIES